MKLAQWFLRRRFLKFENALSQFPLYIPFKNGVDLHLNIIKFPLPKDALCQDWLKLAQWLWRRGWNCEIFTYDRRSEKFTWAFSSVQLIKKKVNWMLFCYILQKYIYFFKIIHDEYIYINSSISCGNHMRLISSVGIIFSVGLFISVELIFFKGHIFNITQYFINVNVFFT